MRHMGLNEIREKYLSFFQSKDHLRLPSFSLIPENDKSLLLIPAGMAPLKPYFTGEQTPPAKRVTTCQKCVRTNDIENVGITARHLTFFEMLGNFSFGDYFKREATKWAWEFVTEMLEMPEDRLYVSIYLEDDEAFDIWTKEVGVDASHIFRMGKADNFWEIGTGSGPCGPCSEIYFDRGEQYACGPDCHPGCDCDRYVEFWNLVFTQFNNDGNDNYTPLEKKNIDTGMGLERIACILQEVDSLFEVDTMVAITNAVSAKCGVKTGESRKTDISLRIITDHIRATVMLVCDGVIPSNEGGGYVLRRLIRRAARHGKLLGVQEPFLNELCDTVFEVSGSAYPQIIEKSDYIKKVVMLEEERFEKTINSGLRILSDRMDELEKEGEKIFSGDDSFKLFDTFGFPVDLTIEILAERGMEIDKEQFDALMQAQRDRARKAREKQGGLGWVESSLELGDVADSVFTGYDNVSGEGKVMAVLSDGERQHGVSAGMTGVILLDSTPFYAESGGQVADFGTISTDSAVFRVTNVQKTPDKKILHTGIIEKGMISEDDFVRSEIDTARRDAIARAHSTVHLLQGALRKVLGNHVGQAGSLVEPDRVRFDFTHFSAMTAEEIAEAESIVNDKILAALPGRTTEMTLEEAKSAGAIALSGEAYGDRVRVVHFGDFSAELCGGTHLKNSSMAGLFKITSETSIAAGVRRIEGVTGKGVLELLNSKQSVIDSTAAALKTNPNDLVRKGEQVMAELKENASVIEKLSSEIAIGKISSLMESAVDVNGISLVVSSLENINTDQLRSMGDALRDKYDNIVALLALCSKGKVTLTAVCGKEAVKRGAHAGNIVKAAAKVVGGGGGGRPDSASAGGRDASKLPEALAGVETNLRGMLK
ncbi:MAG: alanine--tRNA ligase [Clostridiales bacterium]|nr:alanine--tRNA ligase [Clostridiales bacterium]